MYETFEHTADLGLRVWAVDLDTLFADAARGFFSLIAPDLDEIRPTEQLTFKLDGKPTDMLLFDWLNELLFTFETQRMLLAWFEVRVSETGLRAIAKGEPLDRSRHLLDHEVKAITYHGLSLKHTGGQWLAEVIVDI